ncbi:MAG: fructose 1,6-bisphosphatase [Chloroflexi bacterium]|nr:fructose 1,6-bisphosphatase [Chloroflexota bacterium]
MSQTLTVAQAVVGGVAGSLAPHPEVLRTAREALAAAEASPDILDSHVLAHGAAIAVLVSHALEGSLAAHRLAWDVIEAAADAARRLKLDAAGHGLGMDAFPGSLRGTGVSLAEVTYGERPAETLMVGLAAQTSIGAFNLPLVRAYADPFTSPGLALSAGYNFELHDLAAGQKTMLAAPADLHDLVRCGVPGSGYLVKRVATSEGEMLAAASSERACEVTGTDGDDAPVVIARAGGQYPSVDALVAPYLAGPAVLADDGITVALLPMRLPVDGREAEAAGPHPRAHLVALHIADGRIVATRDAFADERFDAARAHARGIAAWGAQWGFGALARRTTDVAAGGTRPGPAAGRWSEI